MGLFGRKKTPEEQYAEGMELLETRGAPKALVMLEKAAGQGHTEAQFQCGKMYYNGEGTEADKARALVWFEEAAGQGHAGAQYQCGRMYTLGRGTAKEETRAFM